MSFARLISVFFFFSLCHRRRQVGTIIGTVLSLILEILPIRVRNSTWGVLLYGQKQSDRLINVVPVLNLTPLGFVESFILGCGL
jgi:hypothetical protein